MVLNKEVHDCPSGSALVIKEALVASHPPVPSPVKVPLHSRRNRGSQSAAMNALQREPGSDITCSYTTFYTKDTRILIALFPYK